MTKYVILTGANGYFGPYIIKELIKQNYGIIACKYPHFASVIIDHESVEYVEFDIRSTVDIKRKLHRIIRNKNVVALINSAALLGSSDYDANYNANTQGVVNLIEICRIYKIRRFIHISSVVVKKELKGPYGLTKLKGQEALIRSELDYTIFISAMIIGPESLGLNRVLKNIFLLPCFVPLIGTGKETQHPVYVKDYARAIVNVIGARNTFRKVYEIAGDSIITFRNFILLILEHYNRKKLFLYIPPFVAYSLGVLFMRVQKVPLFTEEHVKGVLQDSRLNNSALKADIGFEPTPLEVALNDSLEIIGTNWDYYLNERPENKVHLCNSE